MKIFNSIEAESLLDELERTYSEILNYDEIVTRKKYDKSQSFNQKNWIWYTYIYIYIYNQSDISIKNVLRGSFDMSIVFWYNGNAEYALIVEFVSYPLYLNLSYLTLIDHEMGRQAKLFIISLLLPGWFRDCGWGRFTILCDWCVLVPIQVFIYDKFILRISSDSKSSWRW